MSASGEQEATNWLVSDRKATSNLPRKRLLSPEVTEANVAVKSRPGRPGSGFKWKIPVPRKEGQSAGEVKRVAQS